MSDAVDVRLEHVRKRFGNTLAVDGVSLEVRRGEILSLLGPSGCGKTTTLRVIAGLEEVDEGTVSICGEIVNDIASYRRNLGMVFQNYALFPHMSVRDNVAFGLRMRGKSQAEIEERITSVMALVQLSGLEARYPSELSGGQRQRVALARALAPRPAVLLLDEPMAALDKKLREQVQLELKQLLGQLGITTIVVTHDQAEALTLSNRIAVMNEGRIVQLGTPDEVYDRPVDGFVANFLGETNFLAGNLVSIDGRLCSVSLWGSTAVAAAAPEGIAIGERVKLAVRPERLMLAEPEAAGGPDAGLVKQIVYCGATVAIQIALPHGAMVMARVPAQGSRLRWGVGDRVRVSWNPDDARVYRDSVKT